VRERNAARLTLVLRGLSTFLSKTAINQRSLKPPSPAAAPLAVPEPTHRCIMFSGRLPDSNAYHRA